MHRIMFLVRSLEVGGTERQLVELVKNMDHNRFRIHVVTFYDRGSLKPMLETITGVEVTSLEKHNRWDLFSFFIKLKQVVKSYQPELIQSYLDVPNSFNVLVGKIFGIKASLGASASYIDFSRYDWTAALVYKTGALLSHFSDKIVANSNAGQKYNIEHGYSARKMIVIYNGIDTQTFHPDLSERIRMRKHWDVSESEKVIGIVGRFDPMKDHPTFFRAAAIVSEQFPDCRFVCMGNGTPSYIDEIKSFATSLINPKKIIWIHDCEFQDIPAAYNAFDILVSSSYGEGMAVVIGEGMSCGLSCVVTDVGDSAFAVGDTGMVVPSQNPSALAKSILKILEMSDQDRLELGKKARHRVQNLFSIEKMAAAYESAFEDLLK